MSQFIASVFVIVVVSLLQASSVFIYSIKPDLALVSLLVLSLINKSWMQRLVLILLAGVFLTFQPDFDPQIILFIAVTIGLIFSMDLMPWNHLINLAITTTLGTFTLNVYNFDLVRVSTEAGYNLILSLAFFLLVRHYIYNEAEISRNKFR